jgi:Na+-transporting NADH:ubiquinone oxidoreductase subunit A
LATDQDFAMEGRDKAFQKGIDVLSSLTSGKVFLGLDANKSTPPSAIFADAKGAEKVYFRGEHPSGNVGIQIHHVAPIKGKDKVWTLDPQEVAQIGEMFISGQYDASRVISFNGNSVENPCYVQTYMGANLDDLLKNQVSGENQRYISGNPLTGKQISGKGFVGFRDNSVTVIPEGDDYELFGWLLGLSPRPTASGAFPNFLYRNHAHEVTTNTHGERRAFVMTGEYKKVLPMDIYPQQLLKAVLNGDIERMEGLGINELTEEDLALCEFVCTSKMPLQSILREGLDMMRDQG